MLARTLALPGTKKTPPLSCATVLRNLVITVGTGGLLSTSIEGMSAATTASVAVYSFNLRFELMVVNHEQGRVNSALSLAKNAPPNAAASMPPRATKRKNSRA